MASDNVETGDITGVKDKDYNLLWITSAFLKSALRLERFKLDAERDGDSDLADFLGRAQAESRRAAGEGMQLMRSRFLKG